MKNAVKLLLGIAAIAVLVYNADVATLAATIRGADTVPLAGGIGLLVFAGLFQVAKLYALIKDITDFRSTVRLVLVSGFISNFLPSNLGGSLYKIYYLKQNSLNLASSVVLIFVDQLLGICLLVLGGVLCLVFDARTHNAVVQLGISAHSWNPVAIASVAIAVLAVLIGLAAFRHTRLAWVVKALARFAGQVMEAIVRLSFARIATAAVLSILYHGVRVVGVYWIVVSLGAYAAWTQVLVVTAGVAIASVVPLTLGGIGLMEGAFALLLSIFGVPFATALSVGLIYRGVIWAKSLTGGLVLAWRSPVRSSARVEMPRPDRS